MASEVLLKIGIKREPGWLYYLDKQGNAARTPMARRDGTAVEGNTEVLSRNEVKREKGYLYFIDKNGDVARSPMHRGGAKGTRKKSRSKRK